MPGLTIDENCRQTSLMGILGVASDFYFSFICLIYPITKFYVSFLVRYFRFPFCLYLLSALQFGIL